MNNKVSTFIANINKQGDFAIGTKFSPAYISKATYTTINCLPGCPVEFDILVIEFNLGDNHIFEQEFVLFNFSNNGLFTELIEATHPCICEGWNINISEFEGAPVWITIKKYINKDNHIHSNLTSIIGKDASTKAMREEFCVNDKTFADLNNARGDIFLNRHEEDSNSVYIGM